ncbi:MAG: hypothetical protein EBU90_10120 [Proteobacteria bacterium]|nr:hypothetical protein [Pseudomonadota bacterium]
MIINVPLGAFGGPLRNGDIIGVANVVEYLRKVDNPNIKFHLHSNAISDAVYCKQFHQFMLQNTDYFSEEPGQQTLSWKNINLWDFRGLSGDLVKIPNNKKQEKKIVIFPLFDAQYNTYRNWPKHVFENILKKFEHEQFSDYRKIICSQSTIGHIEGWEESTDFLTNLDHIMTSEIFFGGDTGTSHFVGALENGPGEILYFYSGNGLLHTTPFYSTLGKGRIVQYWHNFEQATWS